MARGKGHAFRVRPSLRQWWRMADRTNRARAARTRTETDREVPVPWSLEVTVEQAVKRLRRLSPDKLRRVRAYERQHMNRQTVLTAIDGLLTGQLG
jgi:hypothetical protein